MPKKRRGEKREAKPDVPLMSEPSAEDALERGPFVDGFSRRTVLGAFFVAFVMMPGSIYLGLVAGQTLGPAAEWVTIILFAEIARRSFSRLSRQEVYVLYHVAAGIAAVALAHLALSGGPFAGAIWHQYLRQSPQTSSIAGQIPDWVVPAVNSPAILTRNLAHPDWWWSASRGFLAPVTLIAVGYMFGRLAWFGLGYILFRLTSDIERLPFPLAPIAAEGSTALAESTDRDEGGELRRKRSWRWRVFSIGASLGIIFGALYILLPVVTGLFMAKPVMIFPIPFVDFTKNVEGILPASLISVAFDAGLFLAGMVIPFRIIIGGFVGILATSVFGNAILQKMGAFEHWRPGNGVLVNQMILSFDFWMSVQVGMAGAIFVIGLWTIGRTLYKRAKKRRAPAPEVEPETPLPPSGPDEPPYRTACRERGDFPIWLAAALFLVSISVLCVVCHLLVPGFPLWIIVLFGFFWTPINSYISARLIGITGRGIGVPFLKETAFITSGYRKVDIWFAPIPLFDYGGAAQQFRILELTRTKFTSIFKAELLMFPIIFGSSFVFWWFFWRMNQIPSDAFPFAARTWPVAARQAYLIFTANSTNQSLLLQALNSKIIAGAGALGMVLYLGLGAVGVPVTFFYGLIGGMGQPLHGGLAMFIGALAGRYYFARRFGKERWGRYVPVVAAGFACGMGLAGMTAVGFSLIAQCAKDLPF